MTVQGLDNSISQVIDALPPGLRTDVLMNIYAPLVSHAPFLQRMPPRCIEKVVLSLEQMVYCAGDAILRRGDIGSDMFFVLRGTCDVLPHLRGEVVARRCIGEFFGEMALIYPEEPRSAWILAHTFVIIAKFTRDSLVTILKRFPAEETHVISVLLGTSCARTSGVSRSLRCEKADGSGRLEERMASLETLVGHVSAKLDKLLVISGC